MCVGTRRPAPHFSCLPSILSSILPQCTSSTTLAAPRALLNANNNCATKEPESCPLAMHSARKDIPKRDWLGPRYTVRALVM